jgi:hypothetical protein
VAENYPLAMTTGTADGVMYFTTDGSDPKLPGTPPTPITVVGKSTPHRFHVPASETDGFTPSSIPNLLAYYPLDASANDPVGGFNGTLSGGAAIVAPGKFGGGAVDLNGTSQYIALGNPPALQINSGQITLCAWVKPDAVNGLRNIINRGHDSSSTPRGEITLRINSGAYQGGSWNGTNYIAAGPSTGVNSATNDIGQWVHLASVYDGTMWRLYRNAVEIATFASTLGAVPVPAVGWAIGARGTGTERFFDGQIDEVRIFNRGLTAAEVQSIYENSATVQSAAWAQTAYDQNAWSSGAGGLGFAPAGDPFLALVANDTSAAMSGINSSCCLRIPFSMTAADKSATSLLRLNLKADDGWVAYLNGSRVASRNAPATLTGISTATSETPDAAALSGETIDLTSSIPSLVAGDNVLAIQGLNLSAADDDFLLCAELKAAQGTPNLSPIASAYSANLPLTQSTIVRARTYSPGTREWSALTEAFFQVGPHPCPPGALVISELHYNPQGDDDGEFLELMNASNAAINLRGVKFTAGIDFTFPNNRDVPLAPGQRLTLVDSQFTFQKIHGWAAPLGGIYSGQLDNGGERLTVMAADGLTTLLDFTYATTDPWPTEADGGGRSLVLIAPHAGIDHADPANWRPSIGNDGNPTATDALVFSGSPNADNDGDGLSAWLEFALGTSDSAADQGAGAFVFNAANSTLEVTLDHALGADAAAVHPEASTDLTLWNAPLELTRRQLLPDGRLRSTWRAVGDPARLFLRLGLSPN